MACIPAAAGGAFFWQPTLARPIKTKEPIAKMRFKAIFLTLSLVQRYSDWSAGFCRMNCDDGLPDCVVDGKFRFRAGTGRNMRQGTAENRFIDVFLIVTP
jgi:hypothetical protein